MVNIEQLAQIVLAQYTRGIFPMGLSGSDTHIAWYKPQERCVIIPSEFIFHKRLMRTFRKNIFNIKIDSNFDSVIKNCANREETWINSTIYEVYKYLFLKGFCHTVEAYYDRELVGGLYGIALGGAFMGETMFYKKTDASKICLTFLVQKLIQQKFTVLDCQYETQHLMSFGAKIISHEDYLELLNEALKIKTNF